MISTFKRWAFVSACSHVRGLSGHIAFEASLFSANYPDGPEAATSIAMGGLKQNIQFAPR